MQLLAAFQLLNVASRLDAVKLAAGDLLRDLVGVGDVQAFPDAATRVSAVDDLDGKLQIFAGPGLGGLHLAVRDHGIVVTGRQRFKAGALGGFVGRYVKV